LHLLVAGPFESEDPIPADVEATLRSDPRVHLAGMVHDMPSIYRTLDLLVLPSYREGFNTALLEAAAMGLPVVATRIPGCVDAVRDGETACWCRLRDAQALTAAIATYLGDPALRRRHGANGRRRARREFEPERLREALFQEYIRLLGRRGLRRDGGTRAPRAGGAGSLVWPALPFIVFVAILPFRGTVTLRLACLAAAWSDRRDVVAAAGPAGGALPVGDRAMAGVGLGSLLRRGRSGVQPAGDHERSRLRADHVRCLPRVDAEREAIAPRGSGGAGRIRGDVGLGPARAYLRNGEWPADVYYGDVGEVSNYLVTVGPVLA